MVGVVHDVAAGKVRADAVGKVHAADAVGEIRADDDPGAGVVVAPVDGAQADAAGAEARSGAGAEAGGAGAGVESGGGAGVEAGGTGRAEAGDAAGSESKYMNLPEEEESVDSKLSEYLEHHPSRGLPGEWSHSAQRAAA